MWQGRGSRPLAGGGEAAAPGPATAKRKLPSLALFLAALGPGVIGLVSDNDAGGMLSYAVTGASHELLVILPALVATSFVTLFIQSTALRVAQATGLPYSKVLIRQVGKPLAVVEALVLYGMNTLILVTEFVGMSLALSLAGIPLPVGLTAVFLVVLAMTGSGVYPRLEALLLRVAAVNLVFIPALFFVHSTPGAITRAFQVAGTNPWFLVMALAGNAIAPWMVYWQQNAVVAGGIKSEREQAWDLRIGVVALVFMAGVVLLLGALTPSSAQALASPIAWIYKDGGHVAGILFAVGIFDAGMLAAVTVSLTSLWMLREALGRGPTDSAASPNGGRWRLLHVATLAAAAGVVLAPGLDPGLVALWAQAVGAVWMPVTLIFLGLVARNRQIMGRRTLPLPFQIALGATVLAYITVSILGLLR